jgi:O-antigen/teichoic acid export membrane protein
VRRSGYPWRVLVGTPIFLNSARLLPQLATSAVIPLLVSRRLGSVGFVSYAFVFQVVGYASIVEGGLPQVLTSNFARHAASERRIWELARRYCVGLFGLSLGVVLLLSLLLAFGLVGAPGLASRRDLVCSAAALGAGISFGRLMDRSRALLTAKMMYGSLLIQALAQFLCSLLVLVLLPDHGLVGVSVGLAVANCVSLLLIELMARSVPLLDAPLSSALRIRGEFLSTFGWAGSAIIIGGMDLAVAGWVAPADVAPLAYGVAASAVCLSVLTSVSPVLIPLFVSAGGAEDEGGDLLRAIRGWSLGVSCAGATLVIFVSIGLHIWSTYRYASRALDIGVLLVLGTVIRSTTIVVTSAVLAHGEQQRIFVLPYAEAATNLGLSLLGGALLGGRGISLGTCAGSMVATAGSAFWAVGVLPVRTKYLARASVFLRTSLPPLLAYVLVRFTWSLTN